MHPREGIMLHYDPAVARRLRQFDARIDRPGSFSWAHYSGLEIGIGTSLLSLGRRVERHEPDNAAIVTSRGLRYRIEQSSQPQAASVLALMGRAALRSALAPPDSSFFAPPDEFRGVAYVRSIFEQARRLVAPFAVGEPGYLLSGGKRRDKGDARGNAVQRNMTVGRKQRHELVQAPLAGAMSGLGRIALLEQDSPDVAYLGLAHDYYRAGSDKKGQVRNIMYMLMAERSRENRTGQIGWNVFRLGEALLSATWRGQFGAWKVAARMAGSILTKHRAEAARTDYRAV